MKITDFVTKDNMCDFVYYRQGHLYYRVTRVNDNHWTYMFPVPISDLAEATVNTEEKSLYLMRYIRKALEDGTLVRY